MKRPSASDDVEEGADLDLPVDSAFQSQPPIVSIEAMIGRNADFRRWFPDLIATEEETLGSKVYEEFVL